MIHDKLYGFVYELHKSGNTTINFEKIDISEGDKWYNEIGTDYSFSLNGYEYNVGYSYTTEDAEDYAQAQCFQNSWSRCDGVDISPDIIYCLLEIEARTSKIEKILSL